MERQERTLDWSHGGWEVKVCPLGVGLAHLKAMLENAIDDSPYSKRWLNDVRNIFFLVNCLLLLRESNVFRIEREFLVVLYLDLDATVFAKFFR